MDFDTLITDRFTTIQCYPGFQTPDIEANSITGHQKSGYRELCLDIEAVRITSVRISNH